MKNTRNYSIDLARIFAAFGVIAIHVHFSTPEAEGVNKFFWPLCVPFFFIVSVTYFVLSLKKQPSISQIINRISTRILLPFLVWTIVYAGLLLTKSLIVGVHRDFIWWRVVFYGESALQLYYLPQLVIMQLIALSFYLSFYSEKKNIAAILMCSLIAVLFIFFGVKYETLIPGFLVAVTVYLLSGFFFSNRVDHLQINNVYTIIGFLLVAFAIISYWSNYTYSFLGYPLVSPLGGLGVFLITLGVPIKSIPKWLSELSANSYGIYLSHVLFLELSEFLIAKMHLEIQYTLVIKLLMVAIIFSLSTIFTSVLRQIPFGKKFLLGENK